MNSRLAGTTMCKISFEGVLALKRASVHIDIHYKQCIYLNI